MNEPRTRVGDLGDVTWWANAPASLAAITATACCVLGQRVTFGALVWQLVVGMMSFAVALSRRARTGDVRPTIDRRSRSQGSHGTGWWMVLHVTMVAAGAAPFMWLALKSGTGSDGMSLVAVTAAAVGLLFGTRSGLTISIACSAGTLALALGAQRTSAGWWFSNGFPVWLPVLTVMCLLVASAMVARLGLAELATAPNVPSPFSAPPTDKRGEGLFGAPGRSAFRSGLVITGLCVVFAALLEPLLSPTTQRLSDATADRITKATGGALGESGAGGASSIFRNGSGRGSSDVLGAADSFSIDDFGATSDAEVMRVTVTLGRDRFSGSGATFHGTALLKGQSFDTWDGRSWRSTAEVVRSLNPSDLTYSASDDPVRSGDLVLTNVRLMKGSTNLIFAPSRIAQVDLASQRLLLKDDESVLAERVMGEGSKYSVLSGRHPQRDDGPDVLISSFASSTEELRAYGVGAQHLDSDSLSVRSRALAVSLGAGEITIQGVVRNLETWLAANTVYDYSARQKRGRNSDVVDDFLFDSKAGWCEQFATATVMMLRANGVPARLATGYLPSTVMPDGSFSVLGRDAHAWVEYYVPGYGWAERDPTRVVPVAKLPPEVQPASASQGLKRLLIVFGGLALMGLVATFARRRIRWTSRPVSSVDAAIRSLEQFGFAHDLKRAPGQTLTEYGACLDARLATSTTSEGGATVTRSVGSVVAVLERERFEPDPDGSGVIEANVWIDQLRADFPPPTKRQPKGSRPKGSRPKEANRRKQ